MLTFADPLPARPRRVVVAGVSGVGNTTLARRLAGIVGSTHIEIDALHHGPGWVPRASFLDEVRELVAGETWVTEWQYEGVRQLLAEHADLIVWLDLPFWTTTFGRVVRRTLRRRLRNEVLWNGNVEPPLWTFFTSRDNIVRWAVATRHTYRDRLPALEAAGSAPPIVRLRSRRQVSRWLAGPLAATLPPALEPPIG